jgi:hypothetical protein
MFINEASSLIYGTPRIASPTLPTPKAPGLAVIIQTPFGVCIGSIAVMFPEKTNHTRGHI